MPPMCLWHNCSRPLKGILGNAQNHKQNRRSSDRLRESRYRKIVLYSTTALLGDKTIDRQTFVTNLNIKFARIYYTVKLPNCFESSATPFFIFSHVHIQPLIALAVWKSSRISIKDICKIFSFWHLNGEDRFLCDDAHHTLRCEEMRIDTCAVCGNILTVMECWWLKADTLIENDSWYSRWLIPPHSLTLAH